MSSSRLRVGDLCQIMWRSRAVYGYQFFGSYYVGDELTHMRTTGEHLDKIASGELRLSSCFPFLTLTGRRLEDGTPVVVVHEPILIDSRKLRMQMQLSHQTRICEVLTPEDGQSRWVKAGLLRRVK